MIPPHQRRLSLKLFEPHVGTPFFVPFDNGYVATLTLFSIGRISQRDFERQRVDMFTLYFLDTGPYELRQNSYAMTHDSLGELILFLVPAGPQADPPGMVYRSPMGIVAV